MGVEVDRYRFRWPISRGEADIDSGLEEGMLALCTLNSFIALSACVFVWEFSWFWIVSKYLIGKLNLHACFFFNGKTTMPGSSCQVDLGRGKGENSQQENKQNARNHFFYLWNVAEIINSVM